MDGFEVGGQMYSVEQILRGQEVVDKINKERQEVRRLAHIRALCRIAAAEWIESNPITASFYRQARLA